MLASIHSQQTEQNNVSEFEVKHGTGGICSSYGKENIKLVTSEENRQQVKSAGKVCNRCQARENMQPTSSAGKLSWPSWAVVERGKIYAGCLCQIQKRHNQVKFYDLTFITFILFVKDYFVMSNSLSTSVKFSLSYYHYNFTSKLLLEGSHQPWQI